MHCMLFSSLFLHISDSTMLVLFIKMENSSTSFSVNNTRLTSKIIFKKKYAFSLVKFDYSRMNICIPLAFKHEYTFEGVDLKE